MNIDKQVLDYAWDNFIRSHDIRDSLYVSTANYFISDKAAILNKVYGDLKFWGEVYANRSDDIQKRVKYIVGRDRVDIDKVSFHSKYGWAIQSKGKKSYLGKSCVFGNVEFGIGHRTYISGHATIKGSGVLDIGHYSSIADGLYLSVSDENHAIEYPASMGLKHESRIVEDNIFPSNNFIEYTPHPSGQIRIGSDVWIGRNVKILSGVDIGDGCVVGSETLVTKDCLPFGIYAGIPAKLIRYRFSERIIDQLLEIKWWEWSNEMIVANYAFFNKVCTDTNMNLTELIVDV
jgi:acetyltransferase-like isoleucine patch superfamily enzyme